MEQQLSDEWSSNAYCIETSTITKNINRDEYFLLSVRQ